LNLKILKEKKLACNLNLYQSEQEMILNENSGIYKTLTIKFWQVVKFQHNKQ